MNERFAIVLVGLLACLTACSPLAIAGGAEEWAARNTDAGEKLLCKSEINGEFFFIAQAGEKVKVGSRINMSGYLASHAFIVGWRFKNERQEDLSAKVPPVSVKNQYAKSGREIYAENVQYQTLTVNKPQTIEVSINVKKCRTAECSRRHAREGDVEYTVNLCIVPR